MTIPHTTTHAIGSPSFIDDLSSGDSHAFGVLNTNFRPMILALARGCGLSSDDAEDVAQTTLTAAFLRVRTINDPAALPGWLSTTARREAWRLSGRTRDRLVAAPDLVAAPHEPDEPLLRDESRQLVAAALRTLSPRDQLVLSLTVLADPAIPYVEIAERLGCAVGSIGTFRRRALDRLARALVTTRVRPAPTAA